MKMHSQRMDLDLPRIVVGTSSLGNLFRSVPYAEKRALIEAWHRELPKPVVFDTAGKYGAGLALEVIGEAHRDLGLDEHDVLISNKLAWKRVPLAGAEPTFEPGAWVGIEHDAIQRISGEGIQDCWTEGDQLLGDRFVTNFLSVHDADEYLAAATSAADRDQRWKDILDAYEVLAKAKSDGRALGIGAGAKDWHVLKEISERIDLDWVMIANSLTLYRHPPELLEFVADLSRQGIWVINSALFHSGFLLGGDYFDYRRVDPATPEGSALIGWRETFMAICQEHDVQPLDACVQHGISVPGVASVALSTGRPDRVSDLVASTTASLPDAFWNCLSDATCS